MTSVGDIGYVPEAVEENMEKHFKLAHKWGCVLLLDEADVFLAKRSVREPAENPGILSLSQGRKATSNVTGSCLVRSNRRREFEYAERG